MVTISEIKGSPPHITQDPICRLPPGLFPKEKLLKVL